MELYADLTAPFQHHLLSTRIFVLASFLDVFLCALSLLSLSLLATYPEVRALACDQVSSGEIHALLAFFRGSGSPASSSSPSSSRMAAHSLSLGPSPPSTSNTAAAFVDNLFRRASHGQSSASTADVGTVWWDALMDNVFASENCDEVFATTVVPLILVFSLIYLALRWVQLYLFPGLIFFTGKLTLTRTHSIHFLFVIHRYYVSLLRDRMGLFLSSAPTSPLSRTCDDNEKQVDGDKMA